MTACKAGSSEARVRANRLNGARSRGPKTAAGKACSARNALKHGLGAHRMVLLGDEDESAFAAFSAAVAGELRPEGALQSDPAGRIAAAAWRARRADRLEAALGNGLIRDESSGVGAAPVDGRGRWRPVGRSQHRLPVVGAGRAVPLIGGVEGAAGRDGCPPRHHARHPRATPHDQTNPRNRCMTTAWHFRPWRFDGRLADRRPTPHDRDPPGRAGDDVYRMASIRIASLRPARSARCSSARM
jgi:hypothetical protein